MYPQYREATKSRESRDKQNPKPWDPEIFPSTQGCGAPTLIAEGLELAALIDFLGLRAAAEDRKMDWVAMQRAWCTWCPTCWAARRSPSLWPSVSTASTPKPSPPQPSPTSPFTDKQSSYYQCVDDGSHFHNMVCERVQFLPLVHFLKCIWMKKL